MKHVVASMALSACLLLPSTGAVFATGQPGASAGVTCFTSTSTTLAPSQGASGSGKAVTAQGSVFNGSGTSGGVYAGQPGTPSLANGSSNAVSQYDIACQKVTTQVP